MSSILVSDIKSSTFPAIPSDKIDFVSHEVDIQFRKKVIPTQRTKNLILP